jgi:hypothetical protein
VLQILLLLTLYDYFLLSDATTSLMDSVASLPGCGRIVTDFRGWDTHEVQLCCPDEVDGDT